MAAASVRASSVITSVAPNSARTVSTDRSGQDHGGRALGSALTVSSRGACGQSMAAPRLTSVPPTTATSMAGTMRFHGRASTANTTVLAPASRAMGCVCPKAPSAAATLSNTGWPRGKARPSRGPSWLLAISTAAPAVKPTTTECGTFSTMAPARARPSSSCRAPTRKASVSTSST